MTPAADTTVLDAALAFHDAGISVIPVRTDGSKSPALAWKPYTQQRATRDQVTQWFAGGHPGLGLVTGAVSGNLELLEIEGRAVAEGALPNLAETALASGLADLWRRLTSGYMTMSPSGGVHFLVHALTPVAGNTKLARRPATNLELEQDPKDKIKVLAETRGEGGFVVAAPSHGPVHPTGKPWQRAVGDATTIPDVTADELDALHILLRTLDRMPEPPAALPTPPPTAAGEPRSDTDAFLLGGGGSTAEGNLSPGDDYNARTSWDQILRPAGWTPIRQTANETYWKRPGKTEPGISATTGYGEGDWLYVFSSSTDLPDNQTLTKFATYAHLEHAGDYSSAARELRRLGYGTPPPPPAATPRPAAVLNQTPAPTSTDGGVNAAQPTKDAHDGPNLTGPGVPAPPSNPTSYERTDDSNALRLVDEHLNDLRYCSDRGMWLAWDGHRWRWDSNGAVHEHARTIARDLPRENKEDAKHRTWSLSGRGLNAMVRVAQTDTRTVVSSADLDAAAWELNTPGGVVDLRTGQLRPPDPAALHTRSTTVAPDLHHPPTRWLQFLADTFAGDPDMTTYLQRLLGVALVGQVLEQVLPFAYGEGANGKTTLLGIIMRIIGLGEAGYAITAPADILLASNQTRHTTELARLSGARLVVTSELEDGQQFAEAKIKMLTGGDPITARFMRQDDFTFRPTHTLFLLANHEPAVRTGGTAFWRRVKQIPFLHVVPPEQRNSHLEDELVADEGPQILGWLINGCALYVAHGLAEPASVRDATAHYQRDQDTVARFVDEACATGPAGQQGMRVKVADLRTAYETWCRIEGETPVSGKAFTLTLCSRYGVQRDRDKTARWYDGIRISDLDVSPDPSPGSVDPDPEGWWTR